MPKIYVRVNPRSQISKRHRCATEFTNVWKEIDADDATRAALEEDAYLEVSDTPTVLVEVASTVQTAAVETAGAPTTTESTAAEDSTQGNDESVQNGAGVESATDLRIDAIKADIAKLDPNNAEHWLKDGRPSTAALESVGGLIVTAAERDSIWASLNKGVE